MHVRKCGAEHGSGCESSCDTGLDSLEDLKGIQSFSSDEPKFRFGFFHDSLGVSSIRLVFHDFSSSSCFFFFMFLYFLGG